MLAAIRSLNSSGALSSGGTTGPPLLQQTGVRQGCTLSPALFGIFFDGLHGHLDIAAPHAGVQLGSGRWVSSLVYADDVVLLSWTPAGLQTPLDSMHSFCQALGFTISPSKTEVVVCNSIAPGTWHVGQHVLPQSDSFKYLGLVFHESGSMLPAFAKLAQNGKGAAACLNAKHKLVLVRLKLLMCSKSFSMIRRLFDAVVKPTVSNGCEVWAPACSLAMDPELKDMLGVQMAFFLQLCQFRKSVTPYIIFWEFSARPWLATWWPFLLDFVRRLSLLPDDSLHLDILRDNVAGARGLLPCANWARGVEVKFATLAMASPFISSGIGALNSHSFVAKIPEVRQQTWDGLHVARRAAPSKAVKLCTYHHWFGRPSKVCCEPCYELPMSITRLRALVQFSVGSHSLPVEQGRFVRRSLPRHFRLCNLCSTRAIGDEVHLIFDCPRFDAIRAQYSNLFQDAAGSISSMRLFMWHKAQKAVSHCLTAILQMAQT